MATLTGPLDRAHDGASGSSSSLLGRLASHSTIPRTVLLGFVLLMLGALGVLQVLQTSQVATLGYDLSALEFERAQLQAEIRQLEASIANEGTQAAARHRAEQGLAMVPAEPAFRVSVEESAPAGATVPRRFIEPAETTATETVRESAWWERLLAQLLGAQ
jgi:cell division protein FtsL